MRIADFVHSVFGRLKMSSFLFNHLITVLPWISTTIRSLTTTSTTVWSFAAAVASGVTVIWVCARIYEGRLIVKGQGCARNNPLSYRSSWAFCSLSVRCARYLKLWIRFTGRVSNTPWNNRLFRLDKQVLALVAYSWVTWLETENSSWTRMRMTLEMPAQLYHEVSWSSLLQSDTWSLVTLPHIYCRFS